MNYSYINISQGETWPADAIPFNTDEGVCNPEGLARDAAYDLDRATGPVGPWPQDLEIFADGESLGVYHVERINEPQFFAMPCSDYQEDAA